MPPHIRKGCDFDNPSFAGHVAADARRQFPLCLVIRPFGSQPRDFSRFRQFLRVNS